MNDMGWQIALLYTLGAFLILIVLGALSLWIARTREDFIPRQKIVSHRITPRLPMGDWK